MKRTTLTLLAAMSTTVVLAACSDENTGGGDGGNAKADDDPKAAVMEAFEKTNGAKDMSTTMSLDIDQDLIRKAMSSSGTMTAQDQQMVDKVAELLPKSKITVAQHSRDQALAEEKDVKDLDTAMTFHIGEGKVEVRMIEGGMYMRADVDKLGQETGLFTADQLKMQLTGGQSVSADDPTMQFMNKALGGEWVGITPEKMYELVGEDGMSLEDLTQGSTGGADISPEKQAEIQQDLEGFMDEHGEFTKDGDNIRVSVPIEKGWDDFAAIVNKSITDPAEKMPNLTEDTKKNIKDGAKGYIDIALDGDQLKTLKVDFSQVVDWVDEASLDETQKQDFAEAKEQLGDGPLGMTFDYTQGDAPTKPDQFAEVPQELLDASQQSTFNPGAPPQPGTTQPGTEPSAASPSQDSPAGLSEEEMAELVELIAEMEKQQAEASNG